MEATMTDPLVGRTLDGRYLVKGRIARGGMATVYQALDTRLERVVAVKVMNAGLADDPDFVARFTREARAAARLAHPNVVAVFDQGRDPESGAVFLAMEYVAGRTLRDLLRNRGRLAPDEALDLMRQVLAGLAAAEQAGLVHRDVKPENVLISDDGRVKVVDFGLVHAAEPGPAGQTTQGVLMGTAAYLAPEQVERGVADSRTDVYSAGVVLFEMVTGRPPFAGDTALSVAFQHVHADVPAPSSIVPGLPAGIDALVRSATQRDPQDRPADAAAFLTAVAATRAALPPGAGAAVVDGPDTHPTVVVSRDEVAAAALARVDDEGSGLPRRRRWRGWVGALVVVALAVAAAGLAYWLAVGRWTSVPGVVGLKADPAIAKLESAGLHGKVADTAFSETVPVGEVISTNPAPGHRARAGSTVSLTVSKGPQRVAVPAVVGEPLAQARTDLDHADLAVGKVTREYSGSVERGTVIRAAPKPGQKVRLNRSVDLWVSRGPAPVAVPSVVGMSLADAKATLSAAHFSASVTQDYSDTVSLGSVISQRPSSGTAPYGSTVALVVSKGPKLYPVPHVVGQDVNAAAQVLRDAGFEVRIINLPGGPNKVLAQSPSGGSMEPHNTTITLSVF